MPVLIVSENTSPQLGFSRNRSMRPSSPRDHDAELERVLHALQRQRGHRPAAAVEVDQGREVDVGERVSGDHQEGLVQVVLARA